MLRPTLTDYILKMPRGAQVIYPKDIGPILMLADIFPGARVLESGLGSGALSMGMLRAGAHITGYELRDDFAVRAQRNVSDFLGPEVLDRYAVALRTGDVSQWGELNWQFHSTLYAPSERKVTLGIVHRLHQQSDRYLRMQLALTHGETRANDEHRAIAAAARARDVKKATSLMRAHIAGAGRSLLAFLRESREPQSTVRPPKRSRQSGGRSA